MIAPRKSLSHIWISLILEIMISRFSSKKIIFQWELAGIFLIFICGSFLHFMFELWGRWPPVAFIAAVNESVWEHFKLAFWPALIYAVVEFFPFKGLTKNFWTAKAYGILAMPLIIASIFYGYTALLGHHLLWIDIGLFALSVSLGQMISFLLMIQKPLRSRVKLMGTALLIVMILAFSLFSFLPPKIPLFQDSRSGQYGFLK